MERVIERILNLLAFLLTVGRPVTFEEIRHTVAGYDRDSHEAARRMFERDKSLLRQLGIPIDLRPLDAFEVDTGYVVPPEEYEGIDPGLTDEERAALWLAAQAVRLGGQAPGPGMIFKLGGAPLAAAGEPLAADLGAGAETLGLLFTAVTGRRRLAFDYREVRRRVEPYGLIHRRGHWYVVGRDRDRDEIRSYRVDRATGITVGDRGDAFTRPAGFHPGQALPMAPWEAGEEDTTAVVEFDAPTAWWARRQLTGAEKVEEGGDGSLRVTFRVANANAFLGWLIGFEDGAELLQPLQLREAFVARVRG